MTLLVALVEFQCEIQWATVLALGCSHPSQSQTPRPHAHCGTTASIIQYPHDR